MHEMADMRTPWHAKRQSVRQTFSLGVRFLPIRDRGVYCAIISGNLLHVLHNLVVWHCL
jgi:hypothetical protein